MHDDGVIFGQLKRLVIERTLHHYYDGKDDQLRGRLERRLAATGLDWPGYLALLESGEAAEWASLESEITINETFFFRFAEQFDCLRDTILPSLIKARAQSRRLRIWSAGCSTGAEPYSVAILLHRLLGTALKEWSISILGTDLDENALKIARAGDYGDWALRSLSSEERRRDFIPLGGGGGGVGGVGGAARRWSLRPAYLSMVRFEKHNLLDLLRAPLQPEQDYDLVLCRNVLIYFHQDTVRTLVQRFGTSIAEDGWLLLGHAEAVGQELDTLRPVSLDGTVVWRRRDHAQTPPPRTVADDIVAEPPAAGTRLARRLAARAPSRRATGTPAPAAPASARNDRGKPAQAEPAQAEPAQGRPAQARPAVAPSALADAVDAVRVLADRGLPEDALAACRDALTRHPLSEELFFYAALLHRAMNHDDEAETDFRRALYLCKSFVMANYHLGLLLNETGRSGPGRRHVAEAARIARDLPEHGLLPCGDGMTAGRLRALSRLDWSSQGQG